MTQNKYKYLDKDEEYRMIELYQTSKDGKVMDELIKYNLLNIQMVTRKFCQKYPNIDYNEAHQEASIAMMDSIENFDLSSGNRLISYANTAMVNRMMRKCVYDNGVIRLPERRMRDFQFISQNDIIEPDLRVTKGTLKLYNTYNYKAYDIDEINESEHVEYEEYSEKEFNEKMKVVKSLINKLKPREQIIINHLFGWDGYEVMDHNEISKYLFDNKLINNERTSQDKPFSQSMFYAIIIKIKKMINKENIKIWI